MNEKECCKNKKFILIFSIFYFFLLKKAEKRKIMDFFLLKIFCSFFIFCTALMEIRKRKRKTNIA